MNLDDNMIDVSEEICEEEVFELVNGFSTFDGLHIMNCVKYDMLNIKNFSGMLFLFDDDLDCDMSIYTGKIDINEMDNKVKNQRLRNIYISNTVEKIKFILGKFDDKLDKEDFDWILNNVEFKIKWIGNMV